jgi:hypothetical protein
VFVSEPTFTLAFDATRIFGVYGYSIEYDVEFL